jgi:hypothetical protein
MFRQIAKRLQDQGRPREELFDYYPFTLAGALEFAWQQRFTFPTNPPVRLDGSLPPALLNLLQGLATPPSAGTSPIIPPGIFLTLGKGQQVLVESLIYAYMIENTQIKRIFRKVLYEYLHGERLDIPSPAGQKWVWTTEQLFYKDPPPFFVFSLTSQIRTNVQGVACNAYFRKYGLELNHGTDDGRPFEYEKAAMSNRDFVPTFEKFLFEVWRAIVNARTTSGPNPTDDAAIQDHVKTLFDMLTSRQRNGNLERERFYFVSMMSWLHETVDYDSPIVVDLKAQGSSPGERLKKIAERVGLPAHGRAEDLFSLAEPMSRLLLEIESGQFNDIGQVPSFYRDPPVNVPTNRLRDDIETIITNWSTATGHNIKGEPVSVSPGAVSSATVSPNGGSRVPAPRT